MTIRGWDSEPGGMRMPASGETVNGAAFTVPKDKIAMAVHVPTLIGAATVKIQALDPEESDQVTEVWRDVSVFNLADGTVVPLAVIPSNAVTTLPIAATGGGVLRFVASASQAATPVTIKVTFI